MSGRPLLLKVDVAVPLLLKVEVATPLLLEVEVAIPPQFEEEVAILDTLAYHFVRYSMVNEFHMNFKCISMTFNSIDFTELQFVSMSSNELHMNFNEFHTWRWSSPLHL